MTEAGLPNGWAWATVAELGLGNEQSVLTGPFGSNLRSKDFVSEGHPVLTIGCLTEAGIDLSKANFLPQDIADSLSRYFLESGDMLFSRMASVGRACLVTDEYAGTLFNYHLMRLRLCPDRILPKLFIGYVRGSRVVREYLDRVNHGATRDGINTKQLMQLPVSLPPLREQRRIVGKIEQLQEHSDAAKAALDAIPALLEQFRQSVLAAAFRGDLTKTWRLSAQAAGRQRAQTSELEALPKADNGTWFIYIIQCEDDSYYVGYTTSLQDRWRAHCDGEGADWTRTHKPKYLVHWESFDNQEDALKREKDLKTGFGRTWRKREIKAGRIKPLVHNPDLKTALPVHDTGIQTGSVLLDRIRAERKARFIETTAQTATEKAKTKFLAKHPPKHGVQAGSPAHDLQAGWTDLQAKTLAKETAKAEKKYKPPQPVDDSELPELPEGWCWASLADLLLRLQTGPFGSALHKSDYIENGIPVINPKHLKDDQIRPDPYVTVTNETVERLAAFTLAEGDVILGRRGEMGRCAVVTAEERGWLLGTGSIALEAVDKLCPSYLAWFLRNPNTIARLEGESVGSTMTNLNQKILYSLPVPLAPVQEQNAVLTSIQQQLQNIRIQLDAVRQSATALATLNQSILAKAFRGELVDQDPSDEPASELLARIRQQRQAHAPQKTQRRRTASK